MRYPSFEKFSSESDVPATPGQSPATNTLTHTAAELFWCTGPLSTIKRLLDACPGLTLFRLIVPNGSRYKWSWDVGYQPLVAPRELVKALLETHRQTLQTLDLDFHHYYDLSDPELLEEIHNLEDCDYTYPSFRTFDRLSHLTIEFEKLVKVGDLPASLERLDLRFCHFANLDEAYLSDLVRLRDTWCPVIKVVDVSGWDETDDGIAVVREHARSLDLFVRASVDGQVLNILGVGCRLTIRSLVPPLPDSFRSGDDVYMNNDAEGYPTVEQ